MALKQILFPSLIAFLLLCSFHCEGVEGIGYGRIKGMFVFGSSLVDNGNNNFLDNSRAKADYLPYGIDFRRGPSGRFTNGKNVIDLLGQYLHLPFSIPPFLDPSTKGYRIVRGVNFASGGSGILDETGLVSVNVTTLNKQIRNFEGVTLPELRSEMGFRDNDDDSKSIPSMGKYLFVVGSGGNDYSFNYFLRPPNNQVSLQLFTANLTSTLSQQLKKLYSLGARKILLISVNPLGCYPLVIRANNGSGCIERLNQAAQLFNNNLKSLVDELKQEMPDFNLVFLNSYKIIMDIITDPASRGFNDTTNPCCEVPLLSEGGNGVLCKKGGQTCPNRSKYVFFDGLHTTEAVNILVASKAYASKFQTEVYPTNLHRLAKI